MALFFNYNIKLVCGAIDFNENQVHQNTSYFTGANVSFVGYVRRRSFTESVCGITYVTFNTLFLSVLRKLCFKVFSTYGKYVDVTIIHSTGFVAVGFPCIFVSVRASHRGEAFKLCRYILENIKKNAPIWKMEHCRSGVNNNIRWLTSKHKMGT